MKRSLFLLAVSILVIGCSEAVQTVAWYEEYDEERQARLEKCRSNPGKFEETPNCQNAELAQDNKIIGSTKLNSLGVIKFGP